MPKNRFAWGVVAVLAVGDLLGAVWLMRLWSEREAEAASRHTARQLAVNAQRAAIAAESRRAADAARRPLVVQAERQRLVTAGLQPVSPTPTLAGLPAAHTAPAAWPAAHTVSTGTR